MGKSMQKNTNLGKSMQPKRKVRGCHCLEAQNDGKHHEHCKFYQGTENPIDIKFQEIFGKFNKG